MIRYSEDWLTAYQSRMRGERDPKGTVSASAVTATTQPGPVTLCHSNSKSKGQGRAGPFSNVTSGVRDDIGTMFFKSAWEANYARYLMFLVKVGEIIKWAYEPTTFWFEKIRRGIRSYKPDFQVWPKTGPDYFVEVKGWMYRGSQTKLNRMKKFYPEARIVLVGPKEYRAIARTAAGLIPEWE